MRRFISRRGKPSLIKSDRGTNFTAAESELSKSMQKFDIDWQFLPAGASHMNGVVERQIRTIRKVFTGLLTEEQRLTDDILATLFCEVEGIVNSTLQLLPLEKIFFSRVGLVMFKCSNNMLPNVISNLYIKNNEIHSHFTRNSNLLRIPKGTPNFTTISARVWNEIVTKIIMDQHVSISKFKTMLKSYLLVSSFTLSYTK